MTDPLQEEVFAFVAEVAPFEFDELTLETTLQEDVGIDGKDAVDFFEKFEKQFAVNLSPLKLQWSAYFVSARIWSRRRFLTVLGILSLVSIVIFVCHLWGIKYKHLVAMIAFALVGVLWILLYRAYRFISTEERSSISTDNDITLNDLVEAARQKRWVKPAPNPFLKV